MTPEKRAQSIYETWEYHAAENGAGGPELVTAIAEALRDHGNERLEAAATYFDRLHHDVMSGVSSAYKIRALKDTTDTPAEESAP